MQEEKNMSTSPAIITVEENAHPNLPKMSAAFQLVISEPDFYQSESKVNRFLDACKLPDPTLKQWRASLTNARKELNDKAMELARNTSSPVVMPTEDEISSLACDKFRESWRKVGKGKPMPALPLTV